MEVFLLFSRLLLTGVFATSAIAKLADQKGSAKAMTDFGVPTSFARIASLSLSLFELAIAIGLLFVSTSWFSSLAAAGLLLVFIAMMMFQFAKGNAPDCHCFGQLHSEPVGITSIIRNIVFLIPAGLLSVQGRSAQGLSLVNSTQDTIAIGIAIVVVGLLILAVVFLRMLLDAQAELTRRIEIVEAGGGVLRPQERDNIGHPREGLPIGSLVPDFSLPDLDGNIVTLADLKADGLAVFFLFVSPTCTPCRALLPDIEKWEKQFAGNAKFVYISDGKPEANRKKLNASDGKTILLQSKREVADVFRAKWTPTAVLMNTRGRIVSVTSAGDAGLRRLIGEMKTGNLLHPHAYFVGRDYPLLTRIRIGESIPKVKAVDINGNTLTEGSIKGRETLLTFWSSTCPHCIEMMDQIQEWDASKNGSDPEMVLFVHGKDKVEAAALGLNSRVIVDADTDLGDKLGQFASPSAILVDENGRYISETAIGAEDIWALIGRRF